MEYNIGVFAIILFCGAILGLVILILFVFDRRKWTPAYLFLAIVILNLEWHHLEKLSIITGYYRVFPHFWGTIYGSWFLFGPAIYFCTKEVSNHKVKSRTSYVLHFIPFVLLFGFSLPLLLTETSIKAELLHSSFSSISNTKAGLISFAFTKLLVIVQFSHLIIYLVLSRKIITDQGLKPRGDSDREEKMGLPVLHKFVNMFFILTALVFFTFILEYFTDIITKKLDYTYTILMTGMIIMSGKMLFEEKNKRNTIKTGLHLKKYKSSTLNKNVSENYAQRLEKYMVEEKLYKNYNLDLKLLAEKLNIKPYILSQVINENFDKNFYEFVNTYRINEAKNLLVNNEASNKITVLETAFEVGFNNIVSFNKYFRKITGKTPTEFRNAKFLR